MHPLHAYNNQCRALYGKLFCNKKSPIFYSHSLIETCARNTHKLPIYGFKWVVFCYPYYIWVLDENNCSHGQLPTHHAPHTTHHAPHTTPHTPHTSPHTPHTTHHTPHTTPRTLRPTHHTLRLTHPTPRPTHHTSHTPHTTPHTPYHNYYCIH